MKTPDLSTTFSQSLLVGNDSVIHPVMIRYSLELISSICLERTLSVSVIFGCVSFAVIYPVACPDHVYLVSLVNALPVNYLVATVHYTEDKAGCALVVSSRIRDVLFLGSGQQAPSTWLKHTSGIS